MHQTRLSPAFLAKFAATDTLGTFAGYASTFNGPADAYGDTVAPGAFTKSLDTHAANDTMPALLWQHDMSEPVGRWTAISEDAHGLRVEGKLTLGTQRGAEAYALMKDNALGLSIGFRLLDSERTRDGRLLKQVDLIETSLVALPANPAARVISVKSVITTPTNIRDFEAQLRDVLGFSSREAKRIASGGWRAFEGNRDDPSDELKAAVAALKAAADAFANPHFHSR